MSDQKKLSNILVVGFDLDNTLYPYTDPMQTRVRTSIYRVISKEIGIDLLSAQVLFEMEYNSTGMPWSLSGARTIKEIGKRHGYEANGKDLMQTALEQADIIEFIDPNPEVEKMLMRLFGYCDLDLITGSGRDLAIAKLDQIGITTDLFGNIIAGGEHGSKTTGDAFGYWLSTRNIPANQALYVGDNTRQDIETPHKLGIKTCLLRKKHPDADICISDILDLEQCLV